MHRRAPSLVTDTLPTINVGKTTLLMLGRAPMTMAVTIPNLRVAGALPRPPEIKGRARPMTRNHLANTPTPRGPVKKRKDRWTKRTRGRRAKRAKNLTSPSLKLSKKSHSTQNPEGRPNRSAAIITATMITATVITTTVRLSVPLSCYLTYLIQYAASRPTKESPREWAPPSTTGEVFDEAPGTIDPYYATEDSTSLAYPDHAYPGAEVYGYDEDLQAAMTESSRAAFLGPANAGGPSTEGGFVIFYSR